MNKGHHKRASPIWLAQAWEDRKKQTAHCVETAVGKLREADQSVTLSSIREKVFLLFGRSLSMNTIKRNEHAYQVYIANRRAPKTRQVKSQLILEFYAKSAPEKKAAGHAKVARLRRQSKDDLIVRLLQMEEALTKQEDVANRLREEIIRANIAPQ